MGGITPVDVDRRRTFKCRYPGGGHDRYENCNGNGYRGGSRNPALTPEKCSEWKYIKD
ncbi:MAG: hypothetical protein RBG13Loki_1699 [Promethearchaeota archaeon CR_4]|nr:MAG: hypothetical protein RBG13Loki_1699 [Candidatus Lokiarchaeota archaeon CR_4]